MNSNHPPSKAIHPQFEEDVIDLSELFANLLKKKWLVFFITFLAITIAWLAAFSTTPVYKTDALLQLEKKSYSGGLAAQLGSLSGGLLGGGSFNTGFSDIQIIQSRKILGKVVDKLNLTIQAHPKYFPKFGEAMAFRFVASKNNLSDKQKLLADVPSFPFFSNLNKYAWGGEKITVSLFDISKKLTVKNWTILKKENQSYQLFDNKKTLILEGKVGKLAKKNTNEHGLIVLQVDQLKARVGTHFVLSLISELQAIEMLQDLVKLDEEKKAISGGMVPLSMEYKDTNFAIKVLDIIAKDYLDFSLNESKEGSAKLLRTLNKNLPIFKQNLYDAEKQIGDYQLKNKMVNVEIEVTEAVSSIAKMKASMIELELEKTKLSQLFAPSHPQMLAVDQQLEKLQQQLKRSDRKLYTKVPKSGQEFIRLTRNVQVAQEIYLALLKKQQEVLLAEESTIKNAQIIDTAVASETPLKPKKRLIITVGGVTGLILGIFIALLLGMRGRGLGSVKDIGKMTRHPVLASIPFSPSQAKIIKRGLRTLRGRSQVVLSNARSNEATVESLRSLRASILFHPSQPKSNLIVFSSPTPQVGQSFIIANLASLIADTGKKVLLIDTNMRRSSLHNYLRMEKSMTGGLASILVDDAGVDSVLVNIMENLDFIPAGDIATNSAELLLSNELNVLLQAAAEEYDFVLLETAPILLVSDAIGVAKHADKVLLVLKADTHSEQEVMESIARFEKNGIEVDGLVLNQVVVEKTKKDYQKYAKQYGLN